MLLYLHHHRAIRKTRYMYCKFVMHGVVINVNSRENLDNLALGYCTKSMVSQVVTVDIPSVLVLF